MVWQLLKKLFKREFGSDLLVGISILTAILLAEYLVAAIVVLMLSGGEVLEEYATARASSVLDALARRSNRGEGLLGRISGKTVLITRRRKIKDRSLRWPTLVSGLECLVFLDERYAAAIRFHDAPRKDSASFIGHLAPKHGVVNLMLVSGARVSEVKYLAQTVGITEVHTGKSPEEKVAIVREETAKAKTLFVGDEINDAPALMAATVGVAFGSQNDITTRKLRTPWYWNGIRQNR